MITRRLAAPIATALLAACGPSLYYHRDPVEVIPAGATWSWSPPDGDGLRPDDGAIVPADSIARVIREALTTELTSRGFRLVPADSAQYFVHFHTGRRTVTDTLPDREDPSTIGRSPNPAGGWGTYGRPEDLAERTFSWDEGMLIVDVVTPSGRIVAWRGAISGEIPAHAERDAAAAIREAIHLLLRRFP